MGVIPRWSLVASGLALVFLGVHLVAVSQRWLDPMALSYLMQVAAPLIAAVLAWRNGRDRRQDASTRWRLVALAFVLWAGGMSTSLCIDLGPCRADAGIDVAAYVLYGVPLLLVLATSPSEWSSPLVRVIDAAMTILLTLLILVGTLRLSSGTDTPGQPLAGLIDMFDMENLLLLLFAAIRALAGARGDSRRLYVALAVYTALYFVVAAYYNHHVVAGLGLAAGSRHDVLVGVPFLAFSIAALAPAGAPRPPRRQLSPRLLRFLNALPPFFLTITVVMVGAVVAHSAFGLTIACMVLAVLGYGIRSTLQQAHHIGAMRMAERDRDAMADLAWRDPLTGIGNRRAFDAALHLEWNRARSTEHSLGLLMIDIDHFKAINDALGHVAGDAVIRAVGHALQSSSSQSSDVLARYGGEEFACLLPDCSLRKAGVVAERMRATIEALAIGHPGSPDGVVTVSVGVASVMPDGAGSLEQFVRAADRALYAAKAGGRNRVVA